MKIYSVILMMVAACLFAGCATDEAVDTPVTDTVETTDVLDEESDTTNDSESDVVATEDDTVATESDDVSDDDSE